MLSSDNKDIIMFITRCITSLIEDKEIKRNRYKHLKSVAIQTIETLEPYRYKSDNNIVLPAPNRSTIVPVSLYINAIGLACETKCTSLVNIALDCLQKLSAYGHLHFGHENSNKTNIKSTNAIIEMICACFDGETTHPSTQLLILKALLTFATAPWCQIHDQCLMLLIRTGYNIYIVSDDNINKMTSRATIMQIINNVFNSMELEFAKIENTKDKNTDHVILDQKEFNLINEENLNKKQVCEMDVLPEIILLVDDMINQVVKISTDGKENMASTKSTLKLVDGESNSSQIDDVMEDYHSIYHRDAVLVFRALCRMSSKNIADSKIDIKSKSLALNLIKMILHNSGKLFSISHVLINDIRQYLCISISQNALSSDRDIFELCLSIFVILVINFMKHLKLQIEVFMEEVLFNLLLENFSVYHKTITLQSLKIICSNPQSLVDLYVNYDCDLSRSNLFTKTVSVLSKLINYESNKMKNPTKAISMIEQEVRVLALESLVNILHCMVKWSSDLYVSSVIRDKLPSMSSNDKINKTFQNTSIDEMSPSIESSTLNDSMSINEEVAYINSIKEKKEIVEKAALIFKKKPLSGLRFLSTHKIIEYDAEQIAKFLLDDYFKCDPNPLGKLLLGSDPLCIQIMYHYIEKLDFKDVEFVLALRMLLSRFVLKGESQQIDRMMQKFAEKYFSDNNNHKLFENSDTAYVLAVSVIMLTTDLHNPQIKTKMTKKQYIKMNRGINDSQDLPPEYLSNIYNEIKNEPFYMPPSTETKIRDSKRISMNMMSESAKLLMKSSLLLYSKFTTATHHEHVKPMFALTWSYFLGSFSLCLNESENEQIVMICLSGLKFAIRITCIFQMKLEKDAFIQSFPNFTTLNLNMPTQVMKKKHLLAIRTIIEVAQKFGNYLGSSWFEILKCISHLEMAQLIGSGMVNNDLLKLPVEKYKEIHIIKGSLEEVGSQSMLVAVDRIFTQSVYLDANAIVHFVEALCKVSQEELMSRQKRRFSLQKIVEISYYNMDRIRLVWSRIWLILRQHFEQTGCLESEEVSIFCVDSLRQLSLAFLDKVELSNFSFQKEFLKPFQYIFNRNQNKSIQNMIIDCVIQMVNKKMSKILSGWDIIFCILNISKFKNIDQAKIFSIFDCVKLVIETMTKKNHTLTVYAFLPCIKCLGCFLSNYISSEIAMESIRLLRLLATHIENHKQDYFIKPQLVNQMLRSTDSLNKDRTESDGQNKNYVTNFQWNYGWKPIIFKLFEVIHISSLDIRTRALTVQFDIVKSYGSLFENDWWTEWYEQIKLIFANPNGYEYVEWSQTTSNHTMYGVIDVFTENVNKLKGLILNEIFKQLQIFCDQQNMDLVMSGIKCFENVVALNGHSFDSNDWELVCNFFVGFLQQTMPHSMLTWKPVVYLNTEKKIKQKNEYKSKFFTNMRRNVYLQIEIIKTIQNVLFAPGMSKKYDDTLMMFISGDQGFDTDEDLFNKSSTDSKVHNNVERNANTRLSLDGMIEFFTKNQFKQIIDVLLESYMIAKAFNENNEQRNLLWRAEYDKQNKPNLIELEVYSFKCAIKLLLHIYFDSLELNSDLIGRQYNILNNELINVYNSGKLIDQETPHTISDVSNTFKEHIILSKFLNRTLFEVLEYYSTIASCEHRKRWKVIIILICYHILLLPDKIFTCHIKPLYAVICDCQLHHDMPLELREMFRRLFLRVGKITGFL